MKRKVEDSSESATISTRGPAIRRTRTSAAVVYDLEQKVAEWERKLAEEKTAINDRIYNGDQCVGYRKDVARVFLDAKSSAKSESDPELKPYVDKLVAYWESEEPGHATAIRAYEEAVALCRGMR